MSGSPDATSPPTANAQHGDTWAVDDLFRTEAPRLLRYFRRHTRDCHTAPDLVQDTFLRMVRLAQGKDLANPAAYLQRVARNVLADRARSRKRPAAEFEVPFDDNRDAPCPLTPERDILAADLLSAYQRAVDALPERTRTIFVLKRVEGLTYKQIADQLGVTSWTVEHHMKRAILLVDTALED